MLEFLDLGSHKKKKKKGGQIHYGVSHSPSVTFGTLNSMTQSNQNSSVGTGKRQPFPAFSCIGWSSLPISSLAQPECLPSGKVWKTGSFWEICQFSRKFSKKAGNYAQVTLNQENCYLEWLWQSDLCAKRKQSFQLNPTESANDGTFSAGFESVEPDRFGWILWHMI